MLTIVNLEKTRKHPRSHPASPNCRWVLNNYFNNIHSFRSMASNIAKVARMILPNIVLVCMYMSRFTETQFKRYTLRNLKIIFFLYY